MGVPHGHPAWLMVLRVGHCVCVEAGTVDRGGSVPTPVPPTQLCDLCQLQVERSFLASDGTGVVQVGQPSDPQIKAAATARQGPGSGGPDPSIPSPTQRSASGNPQLRETLGDSKKWGPVWPQDSRLSGGYPCPPLPAPAPPPAPLQGVQFQGLPETQPPAGRPPLLAKALEPWSRCPESSPRRPRPGSSSPWPPSGTQCTAPQDTGLAPRRPAAGPHQAPRPAGRGQQGPVPWREAASQRVWGAQEPGGRHTALWGKGRWGRGHGANFKAHVSFFLVSGSSLGLGTEMSEELRPG